MVQSAVVLAAGEGTRLRPFTTTEPKAMIPVGNRPILEHGLRALRDASVREVVLVVGYKHERVREAMGDGRRLGLRIRYVTQNPQLGTAHALLQAKGKVKGEFLVANGDNLFGPDAVRTLLTLRGADAAMLAVPEARTRGYGVVLLDGSRVRRIVEKPKERVGHLVNTGLYLLSDDIFDELRKTPLSERGQYELTATLQQMVERGADVRAKPSRVLWADAAYPWDLLSVNAMALDRSLGPAPPRGKRVASPASAEVEPGAHLKGPVSLGRGTRVRAGSYLLGPVSIGAHCDVGPNAVLLPSTSVGDGVTIAPFAYVRNSILMKDVRVGPHSHIENSILGHNAHVGAGVHLESRRIPVSTEEGPSDAELGGLVGEGAALGDRTLVSAGRVLGVRCRVGPGAAVREDVPDGAVVL